MPKTKTTEWNPSDHLETREQMALYLEAALEDGDSGVIAAALGDIARSKGMSAIAEETGLGRESLYKSLSENGNPELSTSEHTLSATVAELGVRRISFLWLVSSQIF